MCDRVQPGISRMCADFRTSSKFQLDLFAPLYVLPHPCNVTRANLLRLQFMPAQSKVNGKYVFDGVKGQVSTDMHCGPTIVFAPI